MKRDFLKGLGLEDEAIDKIMTENGKDITDLKVDITNLKGDLAVRDGVIATKDTKISELEKVDVETIKTAEYERGKTEGSAEVEKFKFNSALDTKLKDSKVKDPKVIKGLLDMEKIKYENGVITGVDELITPLKESHDYLFDSDKKLPNFAGFTPGIPTGSEGESLMRSAMGLPIEKK